MSRVALGAVLVALGLLAGCRTAPPAVIVGPGADAPWPEADPALLVDDEVTIAVQVNGKLRDTLSAPKGAAKEKLEEMALASEKVIRQLDGQAPRKVIVVPDRLVNIVA